MVKVVERQKMELSQMIYVGAGHEGWRTSTLLDP